MRGVTQQVVIAGFKGLFQPALPMRGVTRPSDMSILSVLISTRTPHAGSDAAVGYEHPLGFDFNPHSPCGE